MPAPHAITHLIFLIFAGTAILATLALFTRQSLLVAYIALGAILGPWGLKFVNNSETIKQAGDIGIIFLLFLLGLDLSPQSLLHSMRKMSLITLSSSLIFFTLGFLTAFLFGFNYEEALVLGIAVMFSSTIIGIKLLPTTILHHQHTGALVISVLLIQDILAIAALLVIQMIAGEGPAKAHHVFILLAAFPLLFSIAFLFQRYVMSRLLERFDKIHEYIFILSIGWCWCMAELSHMLGLSEEIGAFIAGVSLASHPISSYIVESLKPLRDFFLVLFFFAIGASFNFDYFPAVILPALFIAALMLYMKPVTFSWLLRKSGEVKSVSWEIGIRLGQLSEFSLLIIYLALDNDIIPPSLAYMAEAAIIITFIASCYVTVLRYPTPLAVNDRLRRD